MKRTLSLLAVALLVGLLTSACEPTPTPEPTATATPEPTSTPRPTNTPSPTLTPTPAPVVLSEEELAAIVLGLDDLRPGFVVDATRTGPMTYNSLIEQGSTITAEYLRSTGEFRGYRVVYERRTTLQNIAFVTSWAIAFEEASLASGYLADFPMFFPDATLQPMSFEARGEESVAYKMSGPPSGGFEFDAYSIVIRQRNVVAVVQYAAPLGFADLEELEEYARAQEARLKDVVQGDG